jgi:MoxR-like ATPase
MNDNNHFELYSGDGRTLAERNLALPPFTSTESLDDPRLYLADTPLRHAVNVALALGQPLLVTGEPGTGKTQLAASVAYELSLPSPLVFNAKTTSTAKDLFYRYDALRHFHDVQVRKQFAGVEGYITYEALGMAILLSMEPAHANPYLPKQLQDKGPTRSVVLIDELDKAPRDLPNDVLNEIENMSFTVTESGQTFAADARFRPILILTSNSEKNLPDAFLRRCIFYHIPFPTPERLRAIIQQRLAPSLGFGEQMLENAIRHFEKIRSLPLKKKPATAECLAWLQILQKMNIDVQNLGPGQSETLVFTYAALAKTKEDLALLERAAVPANQDVRP